MISVCKWCIAWKESVFGVILVHIFPTFSRIRTEYGVILRISPHSVRMQENAGNADQNNSEFENFLCSGGDLHMIINKYDVNA